MRSGKVYLIGAGPGAADLLTLRAAERLAQADVVLVDDLVDRGIVSKHCAHARVIAVGKRGGCRGTPQDFIHRLMLRYARQGCTVARLKGGDPFVFGRGAEERVFLERHGVEVELVPGLTAGLAVPALAGIPVTHRVLARAVTLVTGHTCTADDPDWARLAASGATLVIYMGLQRIDAIVRSLLDAGMRPDTPAAVIAQGTTPHERRLVATLATVAAAARAAALSAPALIVVGEVVNYADQGAERIGPAQMENEPARKEARA
jgi:uroporphyrin-III C-methyltransferase